MMEPMIMLSGERIKYVFCAFLSSMKKQNSDLNDCEFAV